PRVADPSDPGPLEAPPDPPDAPGNLGSERFGHRECPEPFACGGVEPVDRLPHPGERPATVPDRDDAAHGGFQHSNPPRVSVLGFGQAGITSELDRDGVELVGDRAGYGCAHGCGSRGGDGWTRSKESTSRTGAESRRLGAECTVSAAPSTRYDRPQQTHRRA